MTWTMDQIWPSPERCGEMWTQEMESTDEVKITAAAN